MHVIDDGSKRHIKHTTFQRPDQVDEPLHVVTTLFNGPRFRTRWKLTEDFITMVESTHKAKLYIVEIALGERAFAFTERGNPQHLQLRTMHEIWFKEAAINLGARLLPPEAKYIAWVDADVHFARYDWADETIQKLQHHPVVQMWSEMYDLNSNQEVMGKNTSFADFWVKNGPCQITYPSYYYPYGGYGGYPGAPGLAWACWTDVFSKMGGLIDKCILGAGDWYMAHGLSGQMDRLIRQEYHPNYQRYLLEWQRRVMTTQWHERTIAGHMGVVPGAALHYYHGPKKMRRYATRDQILVKHNFDPETDLKRDINGLYQLADGKPGMRRDIARYFHERQEDQLAE